MELALYEMRQQMQGLAGKNSSSSYEWGNILDRLMINLYNRVPGATDKARAECREKRIDPALIDGCERLLRENREKANAVRALKAAELPDPATRELYAFLRTRFPKLDESELVRCTLRYSALGQGGQQWALNRVMLQRVHAQGISVEAFASPLNNYFKKYYSIFKSDAPFGSLGSFFEAPLKDLAGGIYANPPFTEAALDGMSQRICEAARDYPQAKFVLITPTWSDAEWYKRLESSGFQAAVKKDEAYWVHGKEIRPKFTTTLWTRNVPAAAILADKTPEKLEKPEKKSTKKKPEKKSTKKKSTKKKPGKKRG